MKNAIPSIAITAGEPAGIGPDLCLLLASQPLNANITIIGDIEMLASRAKQLNINIALTAFTANATPEKKTLSVLHVPVNKPVTAGQLNQENSAYVLKTITIATQACQEGLFDAVVTAPVHKAIINQANIPFTGHTEFLA